MIDTYAKAYTEVLEILKYLPNDEYAKIPEEKINFYKKNKNNNYNYTFDSTKPLNEQYISKEANAIIITLFRDFFATPIQSEKLQKILLQNETIYQDKLHQQYNVDKLFENKSRTPGIEKIENVSMIEYKESLFSKFLSKIKSLFNR